MADHKHGRHHFSIFLIISCCFVLSSSAFQFNVGGRQGWVVNPSENYNTWSGRMRFQVNDTLFFKYTRGGDSVLVVKKEDYDNCNTDKPITKLDDGNSVFKFDRSGPFFFISGNKANCAKGQKMSVVVLAVRNRPPLPTPPSFPSPPSQSPIPTAPSPSSTSPSPSGGTTSPAPTPAAGSPTISPPSQSPIPTAPTPSSTSLSPSGSTTSPAPTPAAGSPTISPSPATQTPVPSPGSSTPAPAVTPSASSPSPSSVASPPSPILSPTATPGSPGLSPPGGGGSSGAPTSGNTPSDIRSPPGSSATSAFTTGSVVLYSTVSLVLCGLVIFI